MANFLPQRDAAASWVRMNNSTDYGARDGAQDPSAIAADVPSMMLESFLPGFGILRRVVLVSTGFDIQTMVAGAFIVGVFFSVWRYVWSQCRRVWYQNFVSEVTVKNSFSLYEDVLQWLAVHAVKTDAKRLAVGRTYSWASYGDNFNNEPTPISYVPAYGTTSFWWQGCRYTCYRPEPDTNAKAWWQNERIVISTPGFSTSPVKRLLAEARRWEMEQTLHKTFISVCDQGGDRWSRDIVRPSRPMNTIYMDDATKSKLIRDAKRFYTRSTKEFYASRGIPFRRGYLFHGPPGTGKSSMSFALAGMLGCTIHYCSLSDSNLNDSKLRSLFNDVENNSIILLEDIDAVGLSRASGKDINAASGSVAKKASSADSDASDSDSGSDGSGDSDGGDSDSGSESEKTESKAKAAKGRNKSKAKTDKKRDKVTLAGLLNVLDGVASGEGRIVIMTTNDPEALDPALVRPGRVDLQVYFGHATTTHAHDMYRRFFPGGEPVGTQLNDNLLDREADGDRADGLNAGQSHINGRIKGLIDASVASEDTQLEVAKPVIDMAYEFASMVPENVLTPAEIQGFLLVRRDDPQRALDEFQSFVDQMRATRAAGTNVVQTQAAKKVKKSEKGSKKRGKSSEKSGNKKKKNTNDSRDDEKADASKQEEKGKDEK